MRFWSMPFYLRYLPATLLVLDVGGWGMGRGLRRGRGNEMVFISFFFSLDFLFLFLSFDIQFMYSAINCLSTERIPFYLDNSMMEYHWQLRLQYWGSTLRYHKLTFIPQLASIMHLQISSSRLSLFSFHISHDLLVKKKTLSLYISCMLSFSFVPFYCCCVYQSHR